MRSRRKSDGGDEKPSFRQIQAMKELLCWVINFDRKVYKCFASCVDKLNNNSKEKEFKGKYQDLNNAINKIFKDKNGLKNLQILEVDSSEQLCTMPKISKVISDNSIKFYLFHGEKDGKEAGNVRTIVKQLIHLTNKKLELFIEVFEINWANKTGFSFLKTRECETFGQTISGQILLILKELQDNGLNEQRGLQTKLAQYINTYIIGRKTKFEQYMDTINIIGRNAKIKLKKIIG